MIKAFILFALLLVTPVASNGGNCCSAYRVIDNQGYPTGYMYIENYWGQWVNCWVSDGYNYNYQFQIPPQSRSRSYPEGPWGCG